MSANSKIEWTDHTFNPWEGCTKVSPGCANCYAEARNHRWGLDNWGKGKPRRRTTAANWKQPLKWDRDSAGRSSGPPARVFCASLADWLDDEVPIQWLADLLTLIHDTPNLDWLLLTKRPQNWKRRVTDSITSLPAQSRGWLARWAHEKEAPQNVWLGTTVESQQLTDRIVYLSRIPARVRFLSVEPMLGPVDFMPWIYLRIKDRPDAQLHWIICGGESGPRKRPFDPDWARSLREQCKASGVPFFMKQIDKVQPIPDDLMIRQFPVPSNGSL